MESSLQESGKTEVETDFHESVDSEIETSQQEVQEPEAETSPQESGDGETENNSQSSQENPKPEQGDAADESSEDSSKPETDNSTGAGAETNAQAPEHSDSVPSHTTSATHVDNVQAAAETVGYLPIDRQLLMLRVSAVSYTHLLHGRISGIPGGERGPDRTGRGGNPADHTGMKGGKVQ